MSEISTLQGFAIALYLLPGFVCVFLYDTLSNSSDEDALNRTGKIVTATVASVFLTQYFSDVQLIPFDNLACRPASGSQIGATFSLFLRSSYPWNFVTAGLLGVAASIWSNRNFTNRFLGGISGSVKTGNDDVWQQTFLAHPKSWCVIVYDNGDQIVGFPQYYSMKGEDKQLFLAKPYRRELLDGKYVKREIKRSGVYINKWDNVSTIEFVEGQ